MPTASSSRGWLTGQRCYTVAIDNRDCRLQSARKFRTIERRMGPPGPLSLGQSCDFARGNDDSPVLHRPAPSCAARNTKSTGRTRMSSKNTAARDPYLVKSVVPSSQLLSAFRTSGEALPLREISARSGLPKSMAFRLLYTLERCGMIEKVGENLYRSHIRRFKQKPFRLGYAAQGTDYQFSKDVSVGLQRAAAAHGVELICVDNRYNPKIAQRNAEVLVREKVDLVIEFQ